MMAKNEEQIIEILTKEAAAKFKNTPPENWTHQDFIDLSLELNTVSQSPISVSTLKRITSKSCGEL